MYQGRLKEHTEHELAVVINFVCSSARATGIHFVLLQDIPRADTASKLIKSQ